MNKIKIFNEQERVKIEFDFENVEVARQYFNDDEYIKVIAEALKDEDDNEGEEEVTSPEIENIKNNLRKLMSTAPMPILTSLQGMIDEELGKRE